jgi:Mn2+/Fe2+ NRAMP family transporter
VRHHRRRRRLRGHGYFKRLGPGIVTGAADDDPSGIGTYSQVGAAYGLGIGWAAVAVAPLAAAVQELAARLGLASGRGLSSLIRDRFPRGVLYAAVTLVAVANTFNIAADLASMGAAAHLVIPIPELAMVMVMGAATIGLEVMLPYHRYSRVLRWLALSLLAYLFVLAAVDVPWNEVARGLVPSITGGRGEIAALIAIFGTTVSPYLFFWQASEEVEEEQEEGEAEVSAEHMTAMRVDVIGGMVSAVAIAFAIIVASAVTLHSAGITNVHTADEAARALEPLAGATAGLVFALGIVGLGLLAIPVLAGSTAYALSEAVGWHEGLSRRLRDARAFYAVIVGSMVLGLALDVAGLDPIRGLYYAAIVNGLTAPPLIVLMFVLGRSSSASSHRSGVWSMFFVGAAIMVSVALPIVYLAW